MADAVSLSLAAGGTASVPLERAATAGYLWHLDTVPEGVDGAEIVAVPGGVSQAAGGLKREQLIFRAMAVGHYQLVLSLRRPWETEPVRELQVNVEVR